MQPAKRKDDESSFSPELSVLSWLTRRLLGVRPLANHLSSLGNRFLICGIRRLDLVFKVSYTSKILSLSWSCFDENQTSP